MVNFWPIDDGLGGKVATKKNIFGFTEKPEFDRKWSTFRVEFFIEDRLFLVSSNGQKTLWPTASGVFFKIFFLYFPL